MGGRRLAGSARRAAERRGALIAVSVLIHAAVLLPIGLSSPRFRAPPDIDVFIVPVDLTPVSSRSRGRRAHVPPDRVLKPGEDAVAAGSGEALTTNPTPLPAAPSAPPAAGDGIEDSWRVRAGLNPPARLPCPAPPGDRLGQRLCLVGATAERESDPEVFAEVGPSRQSASDRAREEGFDRQARANEAWRDYTRGEGAYPGLRSLFSER